MTKGGRTTTSWPTGSSWHHGQTTTIRVPQALADEILQYARAVDQQDVEGDAFLNQQIILQALEQYIEYKARTYHPNQNAKTVNTGTRAWNELRKFKNLVENQPELLLNSSSFETVCALGSNR